jgi:Single-strand binding protein family
MPRRPPCPGSTGRAARPARHQEDSSMPDAQISFAGNLTDDPELRHTEGGIARATLRVAVSGRREQEPSFFTVVVWRDQAEHAAESLARAAGSWWWVGSCSAPGPPRMAAPAGWSRSSPRSWARVCGGRPPRRAGDRRHQPNVPKVTPGSLYHTWRKCHDGAIEPSTAIRLAGATSGARRVPRWTPATLSSSSLR